MKKILIILSFFIFSSIAYGETITIENSSAFTVKIKWSNGFSKDTAYYTLGPGKTLRREQGASDRKNRGNGTFYVTGPNGLNESWNPRRTNYGRQNLMRLTYSFSGGKVKKWRFK